VSIPKHLSTALDAVRGIPKKPPLPDHSKRPLTRPKGCLLPYTHPFATDEVAVIKRSTRYQNCANGALDAIRALEAMRTFAREAYKIEHVGGNAMTYWMDNLKAELRSRDALAEATSEIAVLRQWAKALSYHSVFAGLCSDANAIVCPVEYHLYTTERKQQERATKTAETRRATWEAKHGEAMRAHEALRGEWEAFAQQKANAVVEYRQKVMKDLPSALPSYEFETVDTSDKSVAEAAQSERFAMRERQAQADEERKRYVTESVNVPPFKVQILLRNAWAAGDAYAACLRRALRARDKAMKELETRGSYTVGIQSRVFWELGTINVLLRNVRNVASASIAQTMRHAYPSGDLRPPTWIEPTWVAKAESMRVACAAVRDALKAEEKVHETTIADFRAMLTAHERTFANLPHPEQEPASDDDVPVCTGVSTRAERDAKGWAEAEVVDE